MSNVFTYQPGQTVAIVQQVLNADGYRQDGYIVPGVTGPLGEPIIARVMAPNLSLLTNFPATMVKLDTGLYYLSFILPQGPAALGLYMVDVYWYNPSTFHLQQDVIQIQCVYSRIGQL